MYSIDSTGNYASEHVKLNTYSHATPVSSRLRLPATALAKGGHHPGPTSDSSSNDESRLARRPSRSRLPSLEAIEARFAAKKKIDGCSSSSSTHGDNESTPENGDGAIAEEQPDSELTSGTSVTRRLEIGDNGTEKSGSVNLGKNADVTKGTGNEHPLEHSWCVAFIQLTWRC
jgi:hypothetical protein